jgi:hypothetical protein
MGVLVYVDKPISLMMMTRITKGPLAVVELQVHTTVCMLLIFLELQSMHAAREKKVVESHAEEDSAALFLINRLVLDAIESVLFYIYMCV